MGHGERRGAKASYRPRGLLPRRQQELLQVTLEGAEKRREVMGGQKGGRREVKDLVNKGSELVKVKSNGKQLIRRINRSQEVNGRLKVGSKEAQKAAKGRCMEG